MSKDRKKETIIKKSMLLRRSIEEHQSGENKTVVDGMIQRHVSTHLEELEEPEKFNGLLP